MREAIVCFETGERCSVAIDPVIVRSVLLGASVVLSVLFFPYGLNFYVLMRRAAEYKAPEAKSKRRNPVTIQLPVYNERYVLNRLIKSCSEMADSYGRDLVQIQVLDDSSDDTTVIAKDIVHDYETRGYDIELVHRENRSGFKAGALHNGLVTVKHAFVAIFDADFVPPRDFLERVMPYFEEETLGMVQCKWGHVNRDYNIVTKAIAIGYDGHHLLEQTGRYAAGYLLNFNGSAGILRRSAIENAGGWQPDTLAEDLDLSYRMQLKGWKALYLRNVECSAEIPPTIPAVRKQQARWASGSIRTCRKLIGQVLTDERLTLGQKIESLVHLSFYMVHPLMLSAYVIAIIAAILNVRLIQFDPGALISEPLSKSGVYPDFSSVQALGQFVSGFASWFASYLAILGQNLWAASLAMPQWVALNLTIAFCTVSMWIFYGTALRTQGMRIRGHIQALGALGLIGFGISLSNTIAVAQGVFGGSSGVFVRTPKYRIERTSDTWRDKKYQIKVDTIVLLEILAGIIGIIAIIRAYLSAPSPNWGIMPILFLYTGAYLFIARITFRDTSKVKAAEG
jgi:cellulose synthase/poly-beta-1,6-N-acetylglucosamine synthase-like glycosyltransferase